MACVARPIEGAVRPVGSGFVMVGSQGEFEDGIPDFAGEVCEQRAGLLIVDGRVRDGGHVCPEQSQWPGVDLSGWRQTERSVVDLGLDPGLWW